ncbi:MAG: AbrB/MazE/SpoVT family DNA-binding domain-containing protein [Bacillota bacterium]
MKAKITSKGQLTLPKPLRDKLGLKTGDHIVIKETSEGYVLEKELDLDHFKKYVGYLNQEKDSDKVIKELRDE